MKRALLASFLVLWLGTTGIGASSSLFAQTRQKRNAPAPNQTPDPAWVVCGERQMNREDAINDALEKAQVKVKGYLLAQKNPIEWTPPISFIRKHLIKDMSSTEYAEDDPKGELSEILIDDHVRAFEERRKFNDQDVHETRRVWLKVAITARDREYIVSVFKQQRMFLLLKIVGGVVALCITGLAYIRLDEWSKGSYTAFLRLAAASCAGAVGTGLWLIL